MGTRGTEKRKLIDLSVAKYPQLKEQEITYIILSLKLCFTALTKTTICWKFSPLYVIIAQMKERYKIVRKTIRVGYFC